MQWARGHVLDDAAAWLMSELLQLTVRPDDEIITRMTELATRDVAEGGERGGR